MGCAIENMLRKAIGNWGICWEPNGNKKIPTPPLFHQKRIKLGLLSGICCFISLIAKNLSADLCSSPFDRG
jgi:hypothetical protein